MARNDLTASRVRELLEYDPLLGTFIWVKRPSPLARVKVGDIAGSWREGYWKVEIDGFAYLAHRLAWMYMNGEWPDGMIDHRDGCGTNNRWANLRAANASLNAQNIATVPRPNAPLRGAYLQSGKWVSRINSDGRVHYLGVFNTPEHAHAAYLAARYKHFKYQPEIRNRAPAPKLRAVDAYLKTTKEK